MLQLNQITYIAVGFVMAVALFYVVQIGKRMRELLAVKLKSAVLGLILYAIAIAVCMDRRYPPIQTLGISVAVGLLPLCLIRRPKQSRYVPTRIKRAVVQRDLRGEQYDAKRHHLDHIVPYSKGGDTSVENLRVLSRKANLKKSAKMPRVKDFL
jgi:hypothetical protein